MGAQPESISRQALPHPRLWSILKAEAGAKVSHRTKYLRVATKDRTVPSVLPSPGPSWMTTITSSEEIQPKMSSLQLGISSSLSTAMEADTKAISKSPSTSKERTSTLEDIAMFKLRLTSLPKWCRSP